MGTAVAPEAGTQYTLTNPPPGARFEYDEVKTDRGQKSLGQCPILTWDESEEGLNGAIAFYGASGVGRFVNGTSLRVSCQGIIRRGKAAGKPDDQLAKDQLEFRPGSRQGGQSTPVSRAANATRKAAQKVSGDSIAELMNKIAEDEGFRNQLAALGISLDAPPAAEEEEAETEE